MKTQNDKKSAVAPSGLNDGLAMLEPLDIDAMVASRRLMFCGEKTFFVRTRSLTGTLLGKVDLNIRHALARLPTQPFLALLRRLGAYLSRHGGKA